MHSLSYICRVWETLYACCVFVCARALCVPAPMGGEATAVGGVASAQDISLFGELSGYISNPSGSGGAGFEPTTSLTSSTFHTWRAAAGSLGMCQHAPW